MGVFQQYHVRVRAQQAGELRRLYPGLSAAIFIAILLASSSQPVKSQEIDKVAALDPGTSVRFDAIKQQYITVDNLKIRYIETGQGRTVVLIHGNAGEVEDFEFGLVNSLSRSFKVFAYDRPGHGASERPGGKASSLDFQAELLHTTLLRLGITHPILLGHSWGSALALAYALKYPSETSALVLLAPAVYPDNCGGGVLRLAIKTPGVGDLTWFVGKTLFGPSLLKKDLERAFYPQPVPKDYYKVAASSWLGRKKLKTYFEDEWALNNSLKQISKHYGELTLPVVIVTGDEDRIVSPKDNALKLKSAIPQALLIDLPDTGHEIPLTRPDSVYAAVQMISPASDRNMAEEKPSGAANSSTAIVNKSNF